MAADGASRHRCGSPTSRTGPAAPARSARGSCARSLAALPRRRTPTCWSAPRPATTPGVYRITRRARAGADGRLLHADRRRPYDFGRIAAANALSDVYAMGARPVTALNLVAFSLERLGRRGAGARSCAAARTSPARPAWRSSAATRSTTRSPSTAWRSPASSIPSASCATRRRAPGDVLFLTKPVGGGAVTTAAKRGHGAGDGRARCTEVMTTLNAGAAAAALAVGPSAMTDVTGFGLLGPPARDGARERGRGPRRGGRGAGDRRRARAARRRRRRGRQPPQPRVGRAARRVGTTRWRSRCERCCATP